MVSLGDRFIYARLQKAAADAVIAREGFVNRLTGYIKSPIVWVADFPSDARFLVQFYALIPLKSEFAALHERNIQIGRDRIASTVMPRRL